MKKKIVLAMLAVMTATMVTGCTAKSDSQQETGNATISADATDDTEDTENTDATDNTVASSDTLAISMPVTYLTQYDDNNNCQLKFKAQGIEVLNDGYSALQAALDEFTASSYNEVSEQFETAKSDYASYGADSEDSTEWSYENNIQMQRADNKVVSFYKSYYGYLGGAHPGSSLTGYTYDSQTGKQLELKDVVTDYDKVYDYVLETLKNSDYTDEAFDGWEDTVKAMFYGDSIDGYTYSLSWTMDSKGIEIYFNTYDLAAYACGPTSVEITYADNADLLNSDYAPEAQTQLCQQMSSYVDYDVDVDGDGQFEQVQFQTNDDYSNDDSVELTVIVTKNGSQSTITRDEEIRVSGVYLVQNESGKTYIYADISSYNDYHYIDVFDVSDTNDGPTFVGVSDGPAIYEGVLTDAAHMVLANRIDIFGTHDAYAEYTVGEDGMPVMIGSEYRYMNYNQENLFNGSSSKEAGFSLTLKQDLEVEVSDDASFSSVSNETLSSGTKMYPYATDNSTYVIFKLDDGRYAKVNFEKGADTSSTTVNGTAEDEVFDGIQYAG